MSSSQTLGGSSRAGRIIGPSLDKIIKNVAWRKHSNLVASCKSALDKLETIEEVPVDSSSSCSIYGLSLSDAEAVVAPLLLSLESGSAKVVEPALECIQKLFSFDIVQGEIFQGDGLGWRLVEGVCKFDGVGDDGIEISVLRVLVAAATSTVAMLRGECLVDVVKSLYNLYLGSHSAANQVCAKAVLVQIMLIVCGRVDADRMDVKFKVVSIVDILDLSEKSLNDSSIVQFAQNFINEVMGGNDVENLELKGREVPVQYANGSHEEGNVEAGDGENVGGGSKIRDDGLFLFRNLCKFSMKFSTQDNPEDHLLLRGKILSLELLKTVVENAGQIWRNDDKFLGAIKQYLCLSILKNSALSVMSIFQLLCSIFTGLLSRFRSGLKGEIGIFFPMLVLRVLENVLQPSFLQKLTVLNSLEKVFHDPQIIIDIFVNYDCDVDAPNIFERTVNALLKTALGVPPGSTTTLSPAQDMTFRLESVKCLTCIIKSMGTWMDQQLRIGNFSLRAPDIDITPETPSGEDGSTTDFELQHDMNSGLSDALTLEQTRAYKIEVQKGISLFNRKPSKGIEFLISTKKIGGSPEEVASFLRNASGLNETMIGDYLGDRDEFPLKVMHAYVDLLNFEGMDFGEAIRFFLRGFRLPGEAQKIDRIMEKFAEHYCKCNPSSFTSADTAYVLAYSVIMLNTDAHNNMVKEKMSKVDFIRNNRGIDDGKDLPEDYLGSLYDQIVKNEIKMKSDSSVPQHRQANGINKLLGLDTILNLVSWKQHQEKPLGANDVLIKHIQDQFKANTGKQEPVFYAVMDATILRFMMESCWAPMMAAFSVTLDQSDDRTATSQCLQGFRCAVHVTSVMSMRTQRDAFVTSVAKFTYLHNAADMKQKNVDAVKAIISIAIEDGNYLEDAWEHVLTCLSRFEHLQLLGEGVPTDASFLMVHSNETEEKSQRPAGIQTLKKKALQNPAVIAVMRGGSYDSTSVGINASGLVSQEQISSFISNLNLLDQVGNFELNHIFAHSQRLNSEAIVAFVKALCKVSMAELQSPTDPRVFCLTKIVEIAHYNMNRIRLVWSRIWNVLSDFFVTVGISENLSVAIFVMDSLRQLAMKFLEREELANYNFQNEFLRPFVIVMQKSSSAEIRELIVRCISQMVLSRVNNVKSGWKSVFMVFTCAAADERKNIVQLAFQTIEKIVRDYFPYITETEATIFTDCVRCLITFTNSKFCSDVSLNAIAFLRFCAVKLAEGGLVCYDKSIEYDSVKGDVSSSDPLADKDDNFNYWVPLLAGLSKLTSDPRSAIRKGAMEVLFNILKDHGQLFSHSFWMSVFNSFIFPIFSDSRIINYNLEASQWSDSAQHDEDVWSSETQTVAAQCLVDLYVNFFEIVRHLLPNVVSIFMSFIRSPYNSSTSTGVAALLQLTSNLSSKLTEKEWSDILESLKEAALSTFPEFLKIIRTMESMEIPDIIQYNSDADFYSENEVDDSNLLEDNDLDAASYSVARMKGHIAVQLLLVQALTNLYESHSKYLSSAHVKMIMDIHSSIASHSSELGNETALQLKFQKACTHMDISEPPLVHFENESHQSYLTLLQTLLVDKPPNSEDIGVERQIVEVCQKILHRYLNCASCQVTKPVTDSQQTLHWILPLGSAKKEELAARTSLVVRALHVLNGFERDSFRKYAPNLFPLLVSLVRCEHSSGEVQLTLREIFRSSIGPIILYP